MSILIKPIITEKMTAELRNKIAILVAKHD